MPEADAAPIPASVLEQMQSITAALSTEERRRLTVWFMVRLIGTVGAVEPEDIELHDDEGRKMHSLYGPPDTRAEERAAELGTEFGKELAALANRSAEAKRRARRWTWALAVGVLIMAIWEGSLCSWVYPECRSVRA